MVEVYRRANTEQAGGKKPKGRTALIVLICVAAALTIAFGCVIALDLSQAAGSDFSGISTVNEAQSATAYAMMSEKIEVLIDPGHGGGDPGALSADGTVRESDLNLTISQLLRDELISRGHSVTLTRETDTALAATKDADMDTRAQLINDSTADIVVSVHMNSLADATVSGPIVFCYPGAIQGRLLAGCILDRMNSELEPKRPKEVKQEDLLVLRAGNAPAVLVECGFLSNLGELSRLSDSEYQKRVAASVADGIEDYISISLHQEIEQ